MDWNKVLGVAGIIIGIVALINEQQRLVAAIVLIGTLALYVIWSLVADISKNEERIKKLEENLNIHKDLIDIKATLLNLQSKNRGKK
jgi:uncharacterized membrane protein HdeD (DUF308 family)